MLCCFRGKGGERRYTSATRSSHSHQQQQELRLAAAVALFVVVLQWMDGRMVVAVFVHVSSSTKNFTNPRVCVDGRGEILPVEIPLGRISSC